MKKIILSLMILASSKVWASNTDFQSLPQQEVKLLKVLQQLEPEMIEELLSDAGVEWYLENSKRIKATILQNQNDGTFDPLIQPANLEFGDYTDPNAPKFN